MGTAATTIELDHTIVPSRDKDAAAKFFAHIFGLGYAGTVSHFAPAQVNEKLTLDFEEAADFEVHHYAFKVSEAEFDAIFGRIKADGVIFGSGPRSLENMQINRRNGGRGVYFRDPDGHIFELLTA